MAKVDLWDRAEARGERHLISVWAPLCACAAHTARIVRIDLQAHDDVGNVYLYFRILGDDRPMLILLAHAPHSDPMMQSSVQIDPACFVPHHGPHLSSGAASWNWCRVPWGFWKTVHAMLVHHVPAGYGWTKGQVNDRWGVWWVTLNKEPCCKAMRSLNE